MNSIYESPVFQIANSQYERACEWLDVPGDARERILTKAFQEVLQFGKCHTLWNRDDAPAIGVQKVIEAKRARGLYP